MGWSKQTNQLNQHIACRTWTSTSRWSRSSAPWWSVNSGWVGSLLLQCLIGRNPIYVNLCHYVKISWCGDLFQCARYWTAGDQVFVLHARYHPYVPEGHCRWDCWALADANLLPFASPAAQQSPSSGLAPKMVALKFASSSNGKRQQTGSCASSCDDFDDDF